MLSLEEYIEKRKTEDGINEFDVSQKINNIRTCINYIFEYFDNTSLFKVRNDIP